MHEVMAEAPRQEIKLFYCYAREDKALREELEIHLGGLKRQYHLIDWSDQEIIPGENWEQAINTHLNTADVILLLISPNFMASDYCYGKEMQHALERHRSGSCCVIPILMRPTYYWEDAPFSSIQMLPTDAKPLTRWSDRDEAFHDVVRGISASIKAWLASRTSGKDKREEKKALQGRALTEKELPDTKPHNPDHSQRGKRTPPESTIEKQNIRVIDLSIEAAHNIGADKRPVSLAELHSAYLQANPGIAKGITRDSFDAIINYHTINMRSRFFYLEDKRKYAQWLSQPAFKRVAHARYMLLSPSEVTLFRQRVMEDDPRIYQDEYDVNDLL